MSLNNTSLILRARELCKDTNTTPSLQFMLDAAYISRFNDWWHQVGSLFSRRPFGYASTDAFGLAAIAANIKTNTTLLATHLSIEGAWRMATTTDNVQSNKAGVQLVRFRPHRIISMQQTDPTTGVIAFFSAERIGATFALASVEGLWLFRWHPIPTAESYVSIMTLNEIGTMTSATDVPDLTDEEGYILARLVAADVATLMNQPKGLVQQILLGIPDRILQVRKRAPEVIERVRPAEKVI